jgi:hypothetical protein
MSDQKFTRIRGYTLFFDFSPTVQRVTDDKKWGEELQHPRGASCQTGFEWGTKNNRAFFLAEAILKEAIGFQPEDWIVEKFCETWVAKIQRHSWEIRKEDLARWYWKQEGLR